MVKVKMYHLHSTCTTGKPLSFLQEHGSNTHSKSTMTGHIFCHLFKHCSCSAQQNTCFFPQKSWLETKDPYENENPSKLCTPNKKQWVLHQFVGTASVKT